MKPSSWDSLQSYIPFSKIRPTYENYLKLSSETWLNNKPYFPVANCNESMKNTTQRAVCINSRIGKQLSSFLAFGSVFTQTWAQKCILSRMSIPLNKIKAATKGPSDNFCGTQKSMSKVKNVSYVSDKSRQYVAVAVFIVPRPNLTATSTVKIVSITLRWKQRVVTVAASWFHGKIQRPHLSKYLKWSIYSIRHQILGIEDQVGGVAKHCILCKKERLEC